MASETVQLMRVLQIELFSFTAFCLVTALEVVCVQIVVLYVLQVVLFKMCLEVDVSWMYVHLSTSDDSLFRIVRRFNNCRVLFLLASP